MVSLLSKKKKFIKFCTALRNVVLLLELSDIYLRSAYPKDKIPTCQVHLFLWENKKHPPPPLFFVVDLGQMSFLPWQK